MDIQSEMRLLQTGPGISFSYTIFSSESISADYNNLEIGRAGDLFVSLSTLHFKNAQNQWMVVTEGDPVYNPNHPSCRLLCSDSGPCWGYPRGATGIKITDAIKQHLERIKSGEVFMPEDDDDLDDEDEEEDSEVEEE